MEKVITYSLDKIFEADISIFCDMLSYVSPYILEVKRRDKEVEIKINSDYEADVLEGVAYLENTMKSDEVRKKREVTIKTLKDNTNVEIINSDAIFDELIETKNIIPTIGGVFAYSGLFWKVFNYFNNKINSFGLATYEGIKQLEVPVLQPIEIYDKGRYFESFPHHIMFETEMVNDIRVLDQFSKKGTKDGEIFKEMQTPKNVLRHAACVPIYPMLQDCEFNENEMKTFLVSGKCFRNEGSNVFELARLKEFYMKEYVFVGEQKDVIDKLEKARELWYYWIDVFNLKCKIDTANDSFFASSYKKLKVFQILGDSKQELKVYLPASDTYCAVSSSNVHRTHFTKEHNIKCGDGYCQSTCFAFGIERLTYTLLSQKGLDISKWDKATYKEIFGV